MNLSYTPKNFCKEYVNLKSGSSQIVQFMATVLGIKKSYDDWFDIRDVQKIKKICKKYDLLYKFDWVFNKCDDVSKVADGGKRLPTTRMFGRPFNEDVKEGQVHVFFSKNKKNLECSYRNGWYPLIISNRAVHKPYIDLLRFGYFLGYPECCVDFFRIYNDHSKYNNLYETLRNTKGKLDKYCNPILKDKIFSYIYHMPCSYNCKKTIDYVKTLRKNLIKKEPGFVKKIDEILQKPLLVFNEQNAYIFEGVANRNTINFTDFNYVGMGYNKNHSDLFKRSNKIQVFEDRIEFYFNENLIQILPKKGVDGFIMDFSD